MRDASASGTPVSGHGHRFLDLGRLLGLWPQWAPAAAMAVLSGYAIAGTVGLLGGPHVFAPPTNPENLFGDHWLSALPARTVQIGTVALSVSGVVVLLLQRLDLRRPRPVLIIIGAGLAAYATAVLPGSMSLDAVPGLALLNLKRLDWPTVHVVLLVYTGLAVAASTLAYTRRVRGACVHCGRRPGQDGWPRRRWARVGLAASIAAFVTPLGYAVIRLFWVAGVPVGTTSEFLARLNAANPRHVTAVLELGLAGMAVGGGLLCFGLTRPWSEVWPRWLPGAAGRPVPHWFPVLLGTCCGVGLTGNGMVMLPGLVQAATGAAMYYPDTEIPMTWVSHLPSVSLLLWGPLVLVSILAFHYRTRSRCRSCHQL